MVEALAVWAQAADPISGGAGWVGTGLLGAVLSWLLFVHLPSKDKQAKEMATANADQVKSLVETHDARCGSLTEQFLATLKDHTDQCAEERQANAARSERTAERMAQAVDGLSAEVRAMRSERVGDATAAEVKATRAERRGGGTG